MTQPLPRQFNIQSFADPGAFAGERRILTSEGVQLQEPSASGGPHDHGLGIPIDLIPGPHAIGIVWRAIEEIGTRDRYQLLAQGLRLPPGWDPTKPAGGLRGDQLKLAVFSFPGQNPGETWIVQQQVFEGSPEGLYSCVGS